MCVCVQKACKNLWMCASVWLCLSVYLHTWIYKWLLKLLAVQVQYLTIKKSSYSLQIYNTALDKLFFHFFSLSLPFFFFQPIHINIFLVSPWKHMLWVLSGIDMIPIHARNTFMKKKEKCLWISLSTAKYKERNWMKNYIYIHVTTLKKWTSLQLLHKMQEMSDENDAFPI